MSAGFYNAIVSELEYTLGSRPSRAAIGAPPPNPYERAKMFMDHIDAVDASPMRKVPATLQMEDVHILEQFYSQLCLLVQAQKASDPASLLCIHNVCIPLFPSRLCVFCLHSVPTCTLFCHMLKAQRGLLYRMDAG